MMKTELINPYEVYQRISMGKPYGKNLKPYPKKILLSVIESLMEDEEYEKCIELGRFIKERFKHEGFYEKVVILSLPSQMLS